MFLLSFIVIYTHGLFIHTETSTMLNCLQTEILINAPGQHIHSNVVCLCERSWSLDGYGIDNTNCPGIQHGCASQDCLGGGWCPVSNLNCATAEDRQINVTPCDDLTPVHGECGYPYCECSSHDQCGGYTFCASTCNQGDCSATENVCQPCEVCSNTTSSELAEGDCEEYCANTLERATPQSLEYQSTLPELSESEKIIRLREDCFTACLNNEECTKARQMPDTFLFIYTEDRHCSYGTACQEFFGTNAIRQYLGVSAEHWRIVGLNSEARSYECSKTLDCTVSEFPNCCQSSYDSRSICSKAGSVHCADNSCVKGETYCGNRKGSKKCVPEDIPCYTNVEIYQPAMIIIGIIMVLMFKSYT